MGGGKGAPEEWAAQVKPGRVMYEISGVTEETAREAFRLASHKLPMQCKFLVRGGKYETLEGDWDPKRFVLLEFPTVERAKEWWASPEYQAVAQIRYANATSQMLLVQGV